MFHDTNLNQMHWVTQSDIDHYKVKVSHICCTSVSECQIAARCALRPTVFKLLVNLRQVHQMFSKWTLILIDQKYPIYSGLVSLSTKFQSDSRYNPLFSIQAFLTQLHRIAPKRHWTLQDPRYTDDTNTIFATTSSPEVALVFLSPTFECFAQRATFFMLQTTLTQVHQNDPQIPLNTTRSTGPYICIY